MLWIVPGATLGASQVWTIAPSFWRASVTTALTGALPPTRYRNSTPPRSPRKSLVSLVPVSSDGAPGSAGPADGVSSALLTGGGGGMIFTDLVLACARSPAQTISGPVWAPIGTLSLIARSLAGSTLTSTSSVFPRLPVKITLLTPASCLPETLIAPPPRTAVFDAHEETQAIFDGLGIATKVVPPFWAAAPAGASAAAPAKAVRAPKPAARARLCKRSLSSEERKVLAGTRLPTLFRCLRG